MKLKHKCGTHFSNGPVDVGIVSTHNGRMAYSCEKCVRLRSVQAYIENRKIEKEFTERWLGV